MKDLYLILNKFLHGKCHQALEEVAQGSGVTIPGDIYKVCRYSIKEHGLLVGLALLGWWLDSKFLKVFSKLSNFLILWNALIFSATPLQDKLPFFFFFFFFFYALGWMDIFILLIIESSSFSFYSFSSPLPTNAIFRVGFLTFLMAQISLTPSAFVSPPWRVTAVLSSFSHSGNMDMLQKTGASCTPWN